METKHYVLQFGHQGGFVNMNLDVTAILLTLVAAVVTVLICMAAVRNVSLKRPNGMQNVLEMMANFFRGIAKDAMGDKADTYLPLALTLFIWIFISNQMGVLANFIVKKGDVAYAWWFSPTATLSVTLAMGVGIVVLSHLVGLTKPRQYFKHWVSPLWMFPIHVFDEVPKLLTLGMRLWGNIFAGEVLMNLLAGLPHSLGAVTGIAAGIIPFFIWNAYSLFVGAVQAFIFTLLTLIYIGQKIPQGNHH